MNRLTTRVHDIPVRQSGVMWATAVQKLCEYEDTGKAPKDISEMARIIDEKESELFNLNLKLDEAESRLLDAQMLLEAYQAEGSLMLFRLLKNKYKNKE